AYMASLDRLATLDLAVIFPGHGPPIEQPYEKIAEYVAHRRMREAQIVDAIAAGVARIPDVVARLYADVPPILHGMAGLAGRAPGQPDRRGARARGLGRALHDSELSRERAQTRGARPAVSGPSSIRTCVPRRSMVASGTIDGSASASSIASASVSHADSQTI